MVATVQHTRMPAALNTHLRHTPTCSASSMSMFAAWPLRSEAMVAAVRAQSMGMKRKGVGPSAGGLDASLTLAHTARADGGRVAGGARLIHTVATELAHS